MEVSNISWTDATWNPWMGCDKVGGPESECANCYIGRVLNKQGREPWGEVYRASESTWNLPYRIQKKSVAHKKRYRIFTCSLSDWFHREADEFRSEAWHVIRDCPNVDFLILTKRAHRIKECLPADWGNGWPNVWLGVSVGRKNSIHRIEKLKNIPATVRFISAEPLLESLGEIDLSGIHWLIAGGESGDNYRRMQKSWAQELKDKCEAANIPFFFKQGSAFQPGRHEDLLGQVYKSWPVQILPATPRRSLEPLHVSFVDVHEAGHGIVASQLRVPFKFITNVPEEKSSGHILPRHTIRIPAFADKKARIKRRLEDYIVMCYGGLAATELVFNSADGSHVDEEHAQKIAANDLKIPLERLDNYLGELRQRARQIIRQPWAAEAILQIGVELVEHRKVRSGRVRQICAEWRTDSYLPPQPWWKDRAAPELPAENLDPQPPAVAHSSVEGVEQWAKEMFAKPQLLKVGDFFLDDGQLHQILRFYPRRYRCTTQAWNSDLKEWERFGWSEPHLRDIPPLSKEQVTADYPDALAALENAAREDAEIDRQIESDFANAGEATAEASA
jgi:protein gp37